MMWYKKNNKYFTEKIKMLFVVHIKGVVEMIWQVIVSNSNDWRDSYVLPFGD